MHDRVEWVNPSDRILLGEIVRYGAWLKPSSIHLNVGISQQHVQRRCKALAEHGVLERHPEEVAYRATDLGERWYAGQATPEDLRQ